MIVKQRKNILCIGGGTGLYTLLSGLKLLSTQNALSAVVTMMDSGGSTGKLRDEFGYLPPGDIRRCLLALSDAPQELRALMEHRFSGQGSLSGHNMGNLIITAFKEIAGGEYEAISLMEKILHIRGKVYPVTLDNVHLLATLENGEKIAGETHIDVPENSGRAKITKLELSPPASLFAKTKNAIEDADAIIIGPGDLYTSIMPNLVVEGMADAIACARENGAVVIYVVNTMTKHGETDEYVASDFVRVITSALGGKGPDAIILNNGVPSKDQILAYAKEKAVPVLDDVGEYDGIFRDDLVSKESFARHDPMKLATSVLRVIDFLMVENYVRN